MTPEEIPDDDNVSRLLDHPRTYDAERELLLGAVFEFPKHDPESVVWRKYAPSEEDVHALGEAREQTKRQRKPEYRYTGFITAQVGAIREFKTNRGHGFKVTHEPSQEQGVHHAEIRIDRALDKAYDKNVDRTELRIALMNEIFGTRVPYSRKAADT